ncbi:hypothetical protein MHH85_03485 [Viridibacillus sp. FSL E2-0187]|uniref:hypothetical protein n=1 Tax=Viridibacillus TaxID=496496 RepID=UPI001D117D36|nr:hypothetical protein [Viridibacillus sp. JNUCC-6]
MSRRKYNPYFLPPWLRKTRFYCRSIIVPICCFQGIRVIIVPTTWDIILLLVLALLWYLLFTDFL